METTDLYEQEDWTQRWGVELALAGCEMCDGVFLLSPQKLPLRCPTCTQAELASMDAAADRPAYTQSPELVLPFAVSESSLKTSLQNFAKGIWLAPPDLTPATLIGRLQPVYLPMWLVDADAQAEWQAEAGYDYQVVSHREKFQNGQWQSQEIKETRIRWEPRVGRLQRHYDNIHAPALDEHAQIEKSLGRYQTEKAKPYHPGDLTGAAVRLPNRPPDDAWPEATAALKTAAAEECRLAAKADHIREYRWSARFANQNWTQLLLPLYTSYYLDDDGAPQLVYVQGRSGKLVGRRRASMKRARKWALGIVSAAAVLLVISLVITLLGFTLLPEALPYAGAGFTVAVLVGTTAVLPPAYAWYVNHKHRIDAAQALVQDFIEISQQSAVH